MNSCSIFIVRNRANDGKRTAIMWQPWFGAVTALSYAYQATYPMAKPTFYEGAVKRKGDDDVDRESGKHFLFGPSIVNF